MTECGATNNLLGLLDVQGPHLRDCLYPFELRKWETAQRGTIVIHAGQAIAHAVAMTPDLMALFRGGYVGFCDVHSIVAMNPARWNAWRGKHLDGCWRTRDGS